MKTVVTGFAGFIGSHLTRALLERGHEVIGIDNLSTGYADRIKEFAGRPGFSFDLNDARNIEKIVGECASPPDVIFHLAALPRIQPSISDPLGYHDANVNVSLAIFDYARKWGIPVVYSSSSSIYGQALNLPAMEDDAKAPKNPYALQKWINEQYLSIFSALYGLNVTALRYFNVYGESQLSEGAYATAIGIFLKQKAEGKPFTVVGDGEQRRDFTYVADVVEANIAAALQMQPCMMKARLKGYHAFNIGTGKNYSINDILNAIDPEHPRIPAEARIGEAQETRASIHKAGDLLYWTPKTDLMDWLQKAKERPISEVVKYH
jgi:UDP-glucose 4-epimerase